MSEQQGQPYIPQDPDAALEDTFIPATPSAGIQLPDGVDPGEFDTLLQSALKSFGLTNQDVADMSAAIMQGRIAGLNAGYLQVIANIEAVLSDNPDLIDPETEAAVGAAADASAAGIAGTYMGQVEQQAAQTLLQFASEHGGSLEGAQPVVTRALRGWAQQRAEWKSTQIANAEVGIGKNAGTSAAIDDVMNGDVTLPQGQTVGAVVIAVMPPEAAEERCLEFAGNFYPMDADSFLPDFPLHPHCPHEKVVINNYSGELTYDYDVGELGPWQSPNWYLTPEEQAGLQAEHAADVAEGPGFSTRVGNATELEFSDRRNSLFGDSVWDSPRRQMRNVARRLGHALKDDANFTHLMERLGAKTPDHAAFQLLQHYAQLGNDLHDPLSIMLQEAVRDQLMPDAAVYASAEDLLRARMLYDDVVPGLQTFVGAMYEDTQAALAREGIDHLDVFRGMRWPAGSEPPDIAWNEGIQKGQRFAFSPMTSFTTSLGLAGRAAETAADDTYVMVAGARIPADRILSTAFTGFGGLAQQEVVVLGGEEPLAYLPKHIEIQPGTDMGLIFPHDELYEQFGQARDLIAIPEIGPEDVEFSRAAAETGTTPTSAGSVSRARPLADLPSRYVPQETTAAVQSWLHAAYPHIEFDLADLPVDVSNRVADTWVRLADAYPDVVARLRIFATEQSTWAERLAARDLLKTSFAVSDTKGGRVLLLNSRWYGNPAAMERDLARLVDRGFYAEGTASLESITAHEFGHLVESWLTSEGGSEVAAQLNLLRQAYPFAQSTLDLYAATDAKEQFAEGFRALLSGNPPLLADPYVAAQGRFLDQAMARMGVEAPAVGAEEAAADAVAAEGQEFGAAKASTATVPKTPKETLAAIDAAQKSGITQWAKLSDMTVAQYKKAVSAHLQDLLDHAEMVTRRSSRALDQILDDGRFKSLFETGTSGGEDSVPVRAELEHKIFGYAPDLDAVERPIYGYFADDIPSEESRAAMYGDARIELKPEVRARTSATIGDSLSYQDKVVPRPLPKLDYRAYDYSSGDYDYTWHGPGPEPADWARNVEEDRLATWQHYDPLHMQSVHDMVREFKYPEAQIHGGLAVADIERVTFTGERPSQALIDKLEANGIPWKMADEAEWHGRAPTEAAKPPTVETPHPPIRDFTSFGQEAPLAEAVAPSPTENHLPKKWSDVANMSLIPGPSGSQEGQWYQDTHSGTRYYVKTAHDAAHAYNEVAAMDAYAVAFGAQRGVDIPYTTVLKDAATKQSYVVSQEIAGLHGEGPVWWQSGAAAEARAQAEQLWGADVLLAHWDTVGTGYDNLLLDAEGHPVRVETGGAMAYRAQGAAKTSWQVGGAFDEPWTMRGLDHGVVHGQSMAASVFGDITDAHAAELLEAAGEQISAHLDELAAAWKADKVPTAQIKRTVAVLQDRLDRLPGVLSELRGEEMEAAEQVTTESPGEHVASSSAIAQAHPLAADNLMAPGETAYQNETAWAIRFRSDSRFDVPDPISASKLKAQISRNLGMALKDNPDFQALATKLDKAGDAIKASSTLVTTWAKGLDAGGPIVHRRLAAIQRAIREEFGLSTSLYGDAKILAASENEYAEFMPGLRAFVREMYDQTQAWFADQGIDEVTLYRGMQWSVGAQPTTIAWDATTHRADVPLASGSAFSANLSIANHFMRGEWYGEGHDEYQMLMAARVPVARVLSIPMTGFGARDETEFVLLGDTHNEALVAGIHKGVTDSYHFYDNFEDSLRGTGTAMVPTEALEATTAAIPAKAPVGELDIAGKASVATLPSVIAGETGDTFTDAGMRAEADRLSALIQGERETEEMSIAEQTRIETDKMREYDRMLKALDKRLKGNSAFQKMVKETGAAPMNAGQYMNWNARQTLIHGLIDEWGDTGGLDAMGNALQRAIEAEFGIPQRIAGNVAAEDIAEGKAFYDQYSAGLRALVRAVYDETQAWFDEQGITDITLYRGRKWGEGAQPKSVTWDPATPSAYKVQLSSVSSFATDPDLALMFTHTFGPSDYRMVVATRVPVSEVWSTGLTGFGRRDETEALIFGRERGMAAVAWTKAEGDITADAVLPKLADVLNGGVEHAEFSAAATMGAREPFDLTSSQVWQRTLDDPTFAEVTEHRQGIGDPWLTAAVQEMGRGGLPTDATAATFTRALGESGARELWRGVDPQYVDAFFTGELRMGPGYLGAGLYAAAGASDAAREAALAYNSFDERGLLHLVLSADARTISAEDALAGARAELLARRADITARLESGSITPAQATTERRAVEAVFSDPGRWAALQGYDAIIGPVYPGNDYGEVVLLTRDGVVAERPLVGAESVSFAPATAPREEPVPVNAEHAAEVDEVQGALQRAYATLHDVSVPQYQAAVTAHLQQLVDASDVYVRVRADGLEAVLQDGRFKSAYERPPKGSITFHNDYMEQRRAVERALFGYGDDVPDAERPIYGYLSTGVEQDHDLLNLYGDVAVEFKASVRARTSAVFGDSFGAEGSAQPRPLAAMRYDAYNLPANREDPLDVASVSRQDQAATLSAYVEAEIHGGVSADDIARVVFGGAPPDRDLVAALDARGIPWRMRDETTWHTLSGGVVSGEDAAKPPLDANNVSFSPTSADESSVAHSVIPGASDENVVAINPPVETPQTFASEDEFFQALRDSIGDDGVQSEGEATTAGAIVRDYIHQQMPDEYEAARVAAIIRSTPVDEMTEDMRNWVRGDTSLHNGLHFYGSEKRYTEAFRDQVRLLLAQHRPVGGVDLSFVEGRHKLDEVTQAMVAAASAEYPREWLQASNDLGDLMPVRDRTGESGGFYTGTWMEHGGGEIALQYTQDSSEAQMLTTAVHELGHRLEQAVPTIWKLEQQFYERRTAGEALVDLTNGISQKTKLDRWADQYLGREPILAGAFGPDYIRGENWTSYELVSVGFEWALGETSGAWRFTLDPEYQAFILGILFGVAATPWTDGGKQAVAEVLKMLQLEQTGQRVEQREAVLIG